MEGKFAGTTTSPLVVGRNANDPFSTAVPSMTRKLPVSPTIKIAAPKGRQRPWAVSPDTPVRYLTISDQPFLNL